MVSLAESRHRAEDPPRLVGCDSESSLLLAEYLRHPSRRAKEAAPDLGVYPGSGA
jgi:hypothetical protein